MRARRRFGEDTAGLVIAGVVFLLGLAAIVGTRALQVAARAGDDNLEHLDD